MTEVTSIGWKPAEGAPLSPRQLDVLRRFAAGDSWREVAAALGITVHGVGSIQKQILLKLGAATMANAVHRAHLVGLLSEPAPAERDVRPLLRSLVAAGWSLEVIGSRMGMGQSEVSGLLRREQVTEVMARRVQRMFVDLAGRDPLESGVHRRGYTRARNRARALGWRVIPVAEVDLIRRGLADAA